MEKSSIVAYRISPEFSARLAATLGRDYDLEPVESEAEASERLKRARPALLLAQASDKPSETDVLRVAHKLYPNLPVALLASTGSASVYSTLQTYGIGAAIPPDPELAAYQIRLFFQHLLETGDASGLGRFFPKAHRIASKQMTDPGMRADILQEICEAIEPGGCIDAYDLRSVYEETLNNALHHAFRTERNRPKYSSDRIEPLEEDNTIHVEWASLRDSAESPGFAGIAVTDNQGLLAPQMLWERFFRQTSEKGLLDTSGRGLYLVHLLSSLTAITIWPGVRTEVAVFFGAVPRNREKPISIRVVTDSLF